MHVNLKNEVKYKSLKRNKNKNEVLKILSTAKGMVFGVVFFKKHLTEEVYTDLKLKGLTCMCHALAIDNVTKSIDGNILFVVDRMKSVEEDRVSKLIKTNSIIFRDSKDQTYPLIQLADVDYARLEENYVLIIKIIKLIRKSWEKRN